jgi:hypothetical protein
MTTFWLPCGPAKHQPEVKMESFPAVGATKSLKALFVARCANSFACGSVANVHSSSWIANFATFDRSLDASKLFRRWVTNNARSVTKRSQTREKTLTWSKDQ